MEVASQFDNIEDPWEFLNAARLLDVGDRPQLLDQWLALVSKRPRAEQDALVDGGRDVWKYRLETVRDSLKQLRQVDSGEVKAAPTVDGGEFLAEMIFNPDMEQATDGRWKSPYAYLVHYFDRPDAPPEVVDKIKLGKVVYVPPISPLVERGVVQVASGVEEYLDEFNLFMELEDFVGSYLQLGEPGHEDAAFRRLLCCYVLVTWVYDRFSALPYLRAIGDLDSGKSRLLQTIGALCFRSSATSGSITTASMFRMTDWYRGTLILDEADFSRSEEWLEMVKILNSGYQRGFPVWRAEREREGGQFSVSVYECYGPKLLATRRRFNDAALESRCLSHVMPVVRELRNDIPLALDDRFYVRAAQLRNKLLLWRFRWWRHIDVSTEQRIAGVEPRVNQVIQPLLAVGNEGLQEIVMGMVKNYVKQVQEERRSSVDGAVIGSLIQRWLRNGRPHRVMMKTVTESVKTDRGLTHVSDRRVGSIMDQFSVPKDTRGGITWVLMDEKLADGLAHRFGLRLEDYELAIGANGAGPPTLPNMPGFGGDV